MREGGGDADHFGAKRWPLGLPLDGPETDTEGQNGRSQPDAEWEVSGCSLSMDGGGSSFEDDCMHPRSHLLNGLVT